jgi:hypothetical protein
MQQKLELTAIGYVFTLANIYLTVSGKPLVGIAFGLISCYFFIKALMIKPKDDEKDR